MVGGSYGLTEVIYICIIFLIFRFELTPNSDSTGLRYPFFTQTAIWHKSNMSCLVTMVALAAAALVSGEYFSADTPWWCLSFFDKTFDGCFPFSAINFSLPLCLLLWSLCSSKCPNTPTICPQFSGKP